MSGRPDIPIEVRQWVEKAEGDFRSAEYLLTISEDCPFDVVCFHCQQSAEKYLKALLISRGIPFRKTHDLVILYNLLGGEAGVGLRVEVIQPLNRYSIEARYPGDWNPIGREEAERAMKMARGVREIIMSMLL